MSEISEEVLKSFKQHMKGSPQAYARGTHGTTSPPSPFVQCCLVCQCFSSLLTSPLSFSCFYIPLSSNVLLYMVVQSVSPPFGTIFVVLTFLILLQQFYDRKDFSNKARIGWEDLWRDPGREYSRRSRAWKQNGSSWETAPSSLPLSIVTILLVGGHPANARWTWS